MDHRIEKVLQINALRQAVGCDQEALLGITHGINARAAFIRRKIAGHRLDPQLRKRLAEAGRDVIGGGDEAAEHDRVGTFGDRAA